MTEQETETRVQNLLKLFEGCWFDIVGSSESFMTEKDKREYCLQIINHTK